MKGGVGWNLSILWVDRDPWEFYMSLSREVDIKLCQNCMKIYMYKILYKDSRFKQIIFSKYTTILKTTITQRSLRNSGLLLILFEFNSFSFLIDIIDNIINTSVSCDQNSFQWQWSIFITWLPLYYVTSILRCHWWEFLIWRENLEKSTFPKLGDCSIKIINFVPPCLNFNYS